jgi:diguanylate cyclase (GGDEF)-like protein
MRKVKLYEQIQELAITDGLTGIFVRRHFLERFHEEMARHLRYGLKLSFLMLDIDHFKQQNDSFGHLIGDVILRKTTQILKANLREIDLLGRYGGEEFSIVLPDTDKVGALQAAERIRLAVEEYSFKAYEELSKITISVGIAVFPDDARSVQRLIDCADAALYRAKQEGRNRVCAI